MDSITKSRDGTMIDISILEKVAIANGLKLEDTQDRHILLEKITQTLRPDLITTLSLEQFLEINTPIQINMLKLCDILKTNQVKLVAEIKRLEKKGKIRVIRSHSANEYIWV